MRMKTMICAAALAAPAMALAQSNNSVEQAVDTALTLYNQGPAVVWQSRDVTLESGRQTLTWPSAPAQLIAESLWLAGDGVALLSATVAGNRADSPSALLAERIGQTVTLLPTDDDEAAREATLVSVAGSSAVVRIDDRLELIDGNSDWRIAWPAPQDMVDSDGLQLTVAADSAGEQALTLAYQYPGLNWHASYTGHYDADAGTLTLQSLAVINNNGRTPVQAEQVALVAGDVARESAPQPQMMAMRMSAASAPTPKGQAAGGYYRYELDGELAVAGGATQMLPLMNAQTLDVERELRIEGGWYGVRNATERTHASILLHFDNSTGKPLPAGPVRVYGQAPAMLLGEDAIDNTPVDAPVTLALGQAFEITAEKQVTEGGHEKGADQKDTYQRTIEITVFNARDDAADVTLAERLPAGAEIVSESIEHDKKTAYMAEWTVSVPGNGETTLTYSIRWTQ